ncbi:MAG: beta-lactamase family protein, partial [Gemmatimonadetes bacterium]|nr:beta-lactamase family protein [Gemmatimonadota bacterium]
MVHCREVTQLSRIPLRRHRPPLSNATGPRARVHRAWTATLLVSVLATPALAQELPTANPEAVGMSSERLEQLTEVLNGYVEQDRLAGAAAIVLREGKVVYSKAIGTRDLATAHPMTTDAIFRIASQTKALISVGIMMLQEEGRLLI